MPATMLALENLATTVRLSFYRVNVQAIVTHLGGIGRGNRDNLNTSAKGLVLNEQAQLVKRP